MFSQKALSADGAFSLMRNIIPNLPVNDELNCFIAYAVYYKLYILFYTKSIISETMFFQTITIALMFCKRCVMYNLCTLDLYNILWTK